MHRLVILCVLAAMLVLASAAQGAVIPGRYIVVLDRSVGDPAAVANEHALQHGAQLHRVYGAAIKGYAAVIPAARLDEVRADPRVNFVEPDAVVTASAQTLPWGINKIDADVSSTLAGNGSGAVSNVNVYVIDSGVASHSDINLVGHVNFAGGQNRDCNGHGTHVAGTAAARDNTSDVVGAAPGAPVTGVKVLGCSGSGSWSGVIAGVDWVTRNARKPAVANMSLGGGASQAVDDAIRGSVAAGVFYAVAAGNNAANACNYSPARTGAGINNGILTVAATDSSDNEASWSNFGICVDLWAPGVSILSTRRGGGTTTMSGTSMASPHAVGGAALYQSRNTTAGPTAVENALKSAAGSPATSSKDGRAVLREYIGGF